METRRKRKLRLNGERVKNHEKHLNGYCVRNSQRIKQYKSKRTRDTMALLGNLDDTGRLSLYEIGEEAAHANGIIRRKLNETEEKAALRRRKNAERMAKFRANMSPEEAARRRRINAERMAQIRAGLRIQKQYEKLKDTLSGEFYEQSNNLSNSLLSISNNIMNIKTENCDDTIKSDEPEDMSHLDEMEMENSSIVKVECNDPTHHFLLSLTSDLRNINDEFMMNVKYEIMSTIQKYKHLSLHSKKENVNSQDFSPEITIEDNPAILIRDDDSVKQIDKDVED